MSRGVPEAYDLIRVAEARSSAVRLNIDVVLGDLIVYLYNFEGWKRGSDSVEVLSPLTKWKEKVETARSYPP